MKTRKIDKKLILKKSTIAVLENSDQQAVKGGYFYTKMYGDCHTWHPVCITMPIRPCTDIETAYTCP